MRTQRRAHRHEDTEESRKTSAQRQNHTDISTETKAHRHECLCYVRPSCACSIAAEVFALNSIDIHVCVPLRETRPICAGSVRVLSSLIAQKLERISRGSHG